MLRNVNLNVNKEFVNQENSNQVNINSQSDTNVEKESNMGNSQRRQILTPNRKRQVNENATMSDKRPRLQSNNSITDFLKPIALKFAEEKEQEAAKTT